MNKTLKNFKNKIYWFGRKRSFKLLTINYQLSTNSGFTIVELLIAIGLFSAIVAIAMGGFVRALHTQKQLVALISANSNVSLVVEQMAREMRTGFNFCNDAACPSEDTIFFSNIRGETITYKYSNAPGYGVITRQVVNGSSIGPENQITADNVNIRYLRFLFSPNGNSAPRITVRLGLSPNGASGGVEGNITNIQTTVSARTF